MKGTTVNSSPHHEAALPSRSYCWVLAVFYSHASAFALLYLAVACYFAGKGSQLGVSLGWIITGTIYSDGSGNIANAVAGLKGQGLPAAGHPL
jgi:hypothetical protein